MPLKLLCAVGLYVAALSLGLAIAVLSLPRIIGF